MQSPRSKSLTHSALLALSLLTLVGLPDTARAQNLMVSQSALTFSANVGSTTAQTTPVTISSTSSALSYTITYSSPPYNWLSGDQTSGVATAGATSGKVNISVNPTGLAAGMYSGLVVIAYQNGSSNSISIPVTLTILGASTLVASPTSLAFSAQVNGVAPLPKTLTISAATAGTIFNAAATTTSGGNWLTLTPASAQTSLPAAPNVQVTANPTGLAVGTYSGIVTITSSTSSPLVVPVSLTVTGQPVLTLSQNNLAFFYQINTFPSDVQATVALNTGTIPVAFTASFVSAATSSASCGNWLSFGPTSGTTIANPNLTISAVTSNFTQPATCSGTITISTPAATNPTSTINVSLTVGTNPFLQVSPASISFAYQSGGTLPQMQNLSISSSNGTQPYQVSVQYATAGASWLQVGMLTGNTLPASTISLTTNPVSLAPGTYSATVTITAVGTQNNVVIPVTLTVSANTLLTLSPPYAYFNYQLGQAFPTAETITVGSTGTAVPFTVSVPPVAGGNFLTASPSTGTTSATLTLTANPTNFVPGTYTNAVVITPIASATTPQMLNATLVVSASPLANASPSALTFNYGGAVPAAQQLAIRSTSTDLPFTFSTSGESWLVVSNPGLSGGVQTTPANLTVQVAPQGLGFGTYTSTIMITAGGFTQPIPVTLNVSSGITISATPTTLTFTQQFGVTTPVSLPISIQTSNDTIGVTATATTALSGITWLAVNPSSTTAPGTVTATANAAGLAAGTYTGTITISAAGSPSITVPVTFTITAPPPLTATPIGLTFTGTTGATSPAVQNLQVTASAATQFTPSATTATGGTWLSVPTAALTSPATLPVTVNTAGLAAGTYSGTITLTPVGGGTVLTVPVTLTLAAVPAPAYTLIGNAASYLSGNIAPGEIVSIFGSALGPISPVSFSLTSAGMVPTTLGGVTVTFNGISAPLTYVSAVQINCIVPFELAAGVTSAQVVVSYNGVTSIAQTQPVVATAPGLFTQNSAGTGAASILKPDYSQVTTSNPAPRGSTIIIYATGGGQTTPGSITGGIAGSTLLTTNAAVTVTVGGIPATVAYAGSAPSLVTGVLQINAVLSNALNTGVQPVVITVNGVPSQNTATIAIQ